MTIINNAEIHKFDVGTQIQILVVDQALVPIDIGPATTKEIIFEKPDKTRVVQTAAFPSGGDGSDGLMEYITQANDLDQVGDWRIQGYIVLASGEWRTEIDTFEVKGNQ